jgi:hypothetical protein
VDWLDDADVPSVSRKGFDDQTPQQQQQQQLSKLI